jgi:two-component system cell cycle response regulator CpdR
VREPDEPAQPAQPADIPSKLEHELVNSLASIVGFSEVIRRDPSLPEELRHSAELLAEEATRTRGMVHELLGLLRHRPPEPPGQAQEPSDPPAAADDATASAAGTPAMTISSTTTRPRVLVLEDESSMRVFLEKALALLGYEPVVTALGADAVTVATGGDHAVLLFDHQMVGMSGIDVFDAIVAQRPDLAARVAIMSGDVLDPRLEAFIARHPVAVLAKPFDLDTLDRTIRAVMEATGQSRG